MKRLLLLVALLAAAPLQAKGNSGPTFDKGMVSSADPRASEAGAEMLRRGGSAADAAMAMMLALTVVEPQSSGIGGGGFLLLDDGRGKTSSIDGREMAPAAAGPDWFLTGGQYLAMRQAVPGGISVGVPGNLALMQAAHRAQGKLPWRVLFEPAIRLAAQGFAITPRLHSRLAGASDIAGLTNEGRALFYQADGSPKPVGTVVRNPALAAFFGVLARKGAKAFYKGANAAAIAAAVQNAPRRPARLTEADLAAYRARPRDPVCVTYRAYRLCGMGPPSSGATTVFGILGLLEQFDLRAMGKDNPASWHVITEAMRLTFADRDRYLADSDFVPVPVAGLLAPDYLAARARLIAIDRAMPAVEPGNPAGVKLAMAAADTPDVPSTTHFVAMDRQGRVASMTSTIEGAFGSGVMANGYYLNNELTDFNMVPDVAGKPTANRVEAGKRPLSSMSPTLVYAPDGRLRLAIGAAGGKTIPGQVAKAIIGVIDWNMRAQDAIAMPLVFNVGGGMVFVEEGPGAAAMVAALKARGHKDVRLATPPLKANGVEVIGGSLVGAADPRSEGAALSE